MTEGMYIDPKSLRDLRVNFSVFNKEVLAAAHTGLVNFGTRITERAQRLLEKNGSVVTGLLRGSARTITQPDGSVDAGFYIRYAEYVEKGRGKGKMPPVDEIYQWLYKKKVMPGGKSVEAGRRSMAWAIAKHMAEWGSEAHPFLKPAYEEHRLQIARFMQQKINEVCEHYKSK